MEYQIRGTTMQTVDIQFQAGETIYTESGGMAWMSDNVRMQTAMRGGFLKGLRRRFAGESMFLVSFRAEAGQGLVTFASEFPGKILPLHLNAGESIICQKDAFMCAENSVALDMHFRKRLGAGLFGGEGFIMQRLTGPGVAFVEIAGEVTEYDLQAGQALQVDTGHIAMYQPTVTFDIVRVRGVKNILFGGEGLFLAHVKGPGRVWLQSMPIANLAAKLRRYGGGGGFRLSSLLDFLPS